ncbi:hypothetical protein Tco_1282799 [Tanacetum coccineum]
MDTEIQTTERPRRSAMELEMFVEKPRRLFEAWGRSIEVSYMTRLEILALHSVVMGQQAVISQLQAADRKSQVVTFKRCYRQTTRAGPVMAEALNIAERDLQLNGQEFSRQHGPIKRSGHSLMHQGRLVAVPRFGYVVAIMQPVTYYGLFPASN